MLTSLAPSSNRVSPHISSSTMRRSYRSVGVQVKLPSPPALSPAPPQATRESKPAVTATPQRAPFRPVKKTSPLGHTPGTAIIIPETTIAAPDTATNAPATAPIHEFICLYSHDLRRKQKRWQDGTLRFHTFNQKFMVYDDNGVYVGEGHWQGDMDDFQEGLEIKLDRPMACLQVMECTGTKEQDLSQVLGKRAREVEERRAARAPVRRNREVAAPVEIEPEEETECVIPSTPPSNMRRASAVAVHPMPPRNTKARGASTAAVHPVPPRNMEARDAPTAPTHLKPPKNMGAWGKHAEDLLGRGRPRRRQLF